MNQFLGVILCQLCNKSKSKDTCCGREAIGSKRIFEVVTLMTERASVQREQYISLLKGWKDPWDIQGESSWEERNWDTGCWSSSGDNMARSGRVDDWKNDCSKTERGGGICGPCCRLAATCLYWVKCVELGWITLTELKQGWFVSHRVTVI